jgi:hypothetical protein
MKNNCKIDERKGSELGIRIHMFEVTGVKHGWIKESKKYIHLWTINGEVGGKEKVRVCGNSDVDNRSCKWFQQTMLKECF